MSGENITKSRKGKGSIRIRLLVTLTLLIAFSTLLTGFYRGLPLQQRVSVLQNNKPVSFYNGMSHLKTAPFEIIVDGISASDNIEIFVYDTPEMFYRYSWPERAEDTVLFAPGTGMATRVVENAPVPLFINEENTKNYISADRRINQGNRSIIRVSEFNNILKRNIETDVYYVTLFVDGNKNQIVEHDEVAHLIIEVFYGGR